VKTSVETHNKPIHTLGYGSAAYLFDSVTAHVTTRRRAETDDRRVNSIHVWWSSSWLTYLPLNNVCLTGPLGPRVMDGLTGAGSISQAGFPSVSAADSTGRAPTSVTPPGCN